jgi:hypothetical protein
MTACATPAATAVGTRPLEEDPVALLPGGADLLLDVDVTQLRSWAPARRFLALLPAETQQRIARLGFDPLDDVEQLWAAVAQIATPEVHATLIVRGTIDAARARAALGPPGQVTDTDWHGTQISEGPDGAFAPLTPKLFVLGAPADVRRAVDLRGGEGESLRSSSGDRMLRASFQRAPTAKVGRPAVMASLVPPPALREQLKRERLPGAQFEWVALSLAVGDGFDVGGVAMLRGPVEAQQLVGETKTQLAQFAASPTVRLLGVRPFLDPIAMVARDAEVHFAYRLTAPPVEQLLARLESMQAFTRRAKGGSLNE